MVASTVSDEEAGGDQYQQGHMGLIFKEGFSFSGFERDHLFLNLEGKKFKDISGVSGIDSISDGRAAVFADFDNDGDLDAFLTTIQREGHLLYRNNVGQQKGFIRVTLQGNASGRDAFGAVVRAKTSRGVQTRVKTGGEGFLAQHDPRLLFGMGDDERAEWIEVRWPSGKTQRLEAVSSDISLEIEEGVSGYRTLNERRTSLPDPLSRDERLWRQLTIRQGEKLPPLNLRPVRPAANAAEDGPAPDEAPLFINLWATWCGPCRNEMRHLQELAPRFKTSGIQLLGISLDQEAGPDAILAFAKKLGVSYPLYSIDAEGISRIFAPGKEFVPLSIFVDSEGRIAEVFAGWNPETERRIEQMLTRP